MSQQVIIFCGPDRCGKTTIAKELSLRTGIPYFKASSERDSFVNNQSKFINDLVYVDPRVADLLAQLKASIIMDRGFPCEWVYSRFFSRPTHDKALKNVDELFSRLNASIIMCTRKNFSGIWDDQNSSIGPKALATLSALYETFLGSVTKCRHFELYVDDCDIERQLRDINEFIQH